MIFYFFKQIKVQFFFSDHPSISQSMPNVVRKNMVNSNHFTIDSATNSYKYFHTGTHAGDTSPMLICIVLTIRATK